MSPDVQVGGHGEEGGRHSGRRTTGEAGQKDKVGTDGHTGPSRLGPWGPEKTDIKDSLYIQDGGLISWKNLDIVAWVMGIHFNNSAGVWPGQCVFGMASQGPK